MANLFASLSSVVLRSGMRATAVSVFVALVWFRIPGLMDAGRFWAEEGTIYFVQAWTMPWWQALFLPVNGYLSLAANAAGLLACHLVSIRNAPHVTMGIALAIQALPAVLLASARDDWLARPAVLFPAMFLLGMPPACNEVWLNTANSQFHIEIAAALCLVLTPPSGVWAVLRGVLVFAAPLCGPGSIALAPCFLVRAIWERAKPRAVYAALIIAGSAIQLLVFYKPTPGRGHSLNLTLLALVFSVKHLAIPLLGEQGADRIAAYVHGNLTAGHPPATAILMTIGGIVLVSVAVFVRRRPEPFWLVVCGGALAVLSYAGSVGSGSDLIAVIGDNRYAFASSVLFAFGVLSLAATAREPDCIARTSWVVVIWVLAISVQQTLLPQGEFFTNGPSWKAELAAWKNDGSHPLRIWPTGWVMNLSPGER